MSAKELLNLEDSDHFSDAYNSDEEISKTKKPRLQPQPENDASDASDASDHESADETPLSQQQLEAAQRAIRKSGVVYLSSIPPYMKPQKMKQILERFGKVNRIFLNPEDAKAHKARTRAGGNRKTKYTEGWAEFVRKSDAKAAAEALNSKTIGGRKGSFYYDDILNIKFLKHFKWRDLIEGMALEAQERRERMTAEIAQATKEYKTFADNVEKSAILKNVKERKGGVRNPVQREFRQNKVHKPESNDLDNVLSRVF